MNVTREELAAFADGELGPAREAEVAAAVESDPALEAQVRAHRALKARLGAHFAPLLDAPLPERVTAPLTAVSPSEGWDLMQQRTRSTARGPSLRWGAVARRRRMPRWGWIAGPALAASLALAVFLTRGGDGYASGSLAAALDGQLAATQAQDAETRILLSFRDEAGAFCRAFAGEAQSGIACREAEGWKLRFESGGTVPQSGEYRMAGNPAAEILERAQALAAGPALDAAQEEAARARGWR